MDELNEKIEELEQELADLNLELDNANDEIESLQDEAGKHDDAIADSYQEGYDKALENAVNAVENLQ